MEQSSSRLYSGPLSLEAQKILVVLRAKSQHAARHNNNYFHNHRQIVERYNGSQRELWAQSSWSMSQEESKERNTDRTRRHQTAPCHPGPPPVPPPAGIPHSKGRRLRLKPIIGAHRFIPTEITPNPSSASPVRLYHSFSMRRRQHLSPIATDAPPCPSKYQRDFVKIKHHGEMAGCHIQDPQVSGWLLDPANPSSCYQDLLNKHRKRPHTIPALGTKKTDFEAILKAVENVAVDFTAIWCHSCQTIDPKFEEMENTFPNVIFVKVDRDKADEIIARYDVAALPTFLFFKNTKKVDLLDYADEKKLREKLKALSSSSSPTDQSTKSH